MMTFFKILSRLRRSRLFLTVLFVWITFRFVLFPPEGNGNDNFNKKKSDKGKSDDIDVDAAFKEPEVPTLITYDGHDVLNFIKSFFQDQEKVLKDKLRSYTGYLASNHQENSIKVNKYSEYEIDNFNYEDYNVRIPQEYVDYYKEEEGIPKVIHYDIRFTLASYLNLVKSQLDNKKEDGEKDMNIEIPFHWYDWVDLTLLNKYILFNNDPYTPEEDKDIYNCEYVSTNLVQSFGTLEKREAPQDDVDSDTKAEEKPVKGEEDDDGENTGANEEEENDGESPEVTIPSKNSFEIKYNSKTFCRDLKNIEEISKPYTQNPNSSINFNVFKWTRKSSVLAKILQSRSYLYSGAPTPVSVIFLVDKNFSPNKDQEHHTDNIVAYEFPIKNGYTVGRAEKIIDNYDNIVKPLIERYSDNGYQVNPLDHLQTLVESYPPDETFSYLDENLYKITSDPEDFTVRLTTKEFEYNVKEEISNYNELLSKKELPKTPLEKLSHNKQVFHLNSLIHSYKTKDSATKKYFHEVPIAHSKQGDNSKRDNKAGGHYDWRFFNGFIYDEETTRRTLHHLVRVFLKFTYSKNIPTWMAHGSLLSWYWNGLNFPWDNDIDVQMSIRSLQKFCKLYNNTLIVENLNDGLGRYYVDCGAYLTHRTKGFGRNNIDARFVDVDRGIYIDITGLALTDAQLPRKYKNWKRDIVTRSESSYPFSIQDKSFFNDSSSSLVKKAIIPPQPISPGRIEKLYKDDLTPEERMSKNNRLQVFNCKNNHFVFYSQLSPLKPALIEGTKGFVPGNYRQVLSDDYGSVSLTNQYYAKHFFLKKLRLWIPSAKFRSFFKKLIRDGDKHYKKSLSKSLAGIDNDLVDILRFMEYDNSVLRQYYLHQKITAHHEREMNLLESGKPNEFWKDEFRPILKDLFLYKMNDLKEDEKDEQKEMYDSIKDSFNENNNKGENNENSPDEK